MGLSKSYKFNERQNKFASLAKALGHPARIAIIEVLIRRNACVCGDIVDELPLSQSTISQHLKELKSAGLVNGTIEGPSTCYCIDEQVWEEIEELFTGLFSQVSKSCC